jgi:RNA recognition motif-containing protein
MAFCEFLFVYRTKPAIILSIGLLSIFYLFIYFQKMNIFIAGLSFKVNDADLSNLFEEYGTIRSARVITDRQTGKSKGYGFVEIDDEEAANQAIAELNGAEYDGRTLSVSEAREKEERPRREFRGGGNRGGGGYGGGGYNRNRY